MSLTLFDACCRLPIWYMFVGVDNNGLGGDQSAGVIVAGRLTRYETVLDCREDADGVGIES